MEGAGRRPEAGAAACSITGLSFRSSQVTAAVSATVTTAAAAIHTGRR